MRHLILSSLVLVACGPMSLVPYAGAQVGTIPPMSSVMTNSQTVLGPCSGDDGSSCGGGKGVCVPSMNLPNQKQCLATTTASCPRGSFSAEYKAGVRACLDLCSTVRDCGAGFFCNSTVLRDERGVVQDVKVCAPGAVNHAGRHCTTQSDCDLASTTLLCSGATSSTPGICTKPCDTSASCSSSDNPAVCGKNSAGQGFCFESCIGGDTCLGGLVCRNNLCLPASAAAPTFPTPSFGQTGGACTAHRDCPGGFCGTSDPGGSCSAGCTSDSQCGSNGVCVTLVSGQQSFCYAKCSTPDTKSNCRSQYLCRPLRDVSYGFCDRG